MANPQAFSIRDHNMHFLVILGAASLKKPKGCYISEPLVDKLDKDTIEWFKLTNVPETLKLRSYAPELFTYIHRKTIGKHQFYSFWQECYYLLSLTYNKKA